MTSPSGHPPAGQGAASEAAGTIVNGREVAGPATTSSARTREATASRPAGAPSAGEGNGSAGSPVAGAASVVAVSAGGGPARPGVAGTASAEDGLAENVAGTVAAGTGPATVEEAAGRDDAADGRPRPYKPGRRWAWFLPSAVSLAASLWGITTPSFWRDEAATIAAVQRPFADLISMLGNVDAVHSVYYMLMWPLVHIFGPKELVLRLPSALAMAGAAGGVAAIGRRVISPGAGLAAGLLYAALPVVSRYGQEARSYAFVILVAVISSYLLVRVMDAELAAAGARGSPPGNAPAGARGSSPGNAPAGARGSSPENAHRRRWLVAYSASLALLGIVNIFGLLLIGGHTVTVALQYRRHAGNHAMRRLAIDWLIAVFAAIVVASPMLAFGLKEHSQIAWIAVNTPKLSTLLQLTGSFFVTVAIVVVIGVASVVAIEASRDWRRSHWSSRLAELCLPWLIVPPVALLAASVISPIYTSRYILICVPPIALLGGAAIAALGRIGAPIALAAIVVTGLPGTGGQFAVRSAAGHYDDIRGLDQVVVAQKQPGDVVLYTNPNAESFGSAYSYGLGSLPNIAQGQAAIPSGTLAGTQLPLGAIQAKLGSVSRVWIVEINRCVSPPQLLRLNGSSLGPTPTLQGLPLHFVHFWHLHGDWLLLYAHGAGSQLVQPELSCVPTTTPASS